MWISIAALNLALAVVFGAFGAHALKLKLTLEQMAWWQTATLYFFIHALGLLAIGIFIKITHIPTLNQKLNHSAISLQLGIIVFCGSLYLMALGAPRWLGAITPIGGSCFIIGWLMLGYAAFKHDTRFKQ